MTDSARAACKSNWSGSLTRLSPRWSFFIALFFVVLFDAYSLDTDPVLTGGFWVEVDPFVETETGYQLTADQARRRLLEEARYIFSGIIYGFDFVYTPSDAMRKVDEIFTFEAVAQIPWGDPALSIVETWVEGNLFRGNLRYYPSDHQLRWLDMMQSNIYHNATGRGSASMFSGVSAKYDAVAEAAKEAIRGHLRQRIFNKPKEVRGRVALTGAPYIIIDAGEYVAKVDIRIDVDEIIPYRMY